MLNIISPRSARRRARGVTLIELLVGVAVGIIVVGALVAFIVSSVQANSENLRSIRLTQELRALTEVIGREIRRARYVPAMDLLEAVGQATVPDDVTRFSPVLVQDGCVEFAYGTDPNLGVQSRLWLDTGDGRIWGWRNPLDESSVPDPTSFCSGTPAGADAISSPEVEILRFVVVGTDNSPGPQTAPPLCELADAGAYDGGADSPCSDTGPTVNNACAAIDICITGRLGAGANEVTRTFGQRIRIRSSANPPPVASP